MNSDNPLLVVLAGPTAAGKTAAGITLAQHFQTEIISADSRQFYQEMKIGTAAPAAEELSQAPHHFVRHLSVHVPYNVSRFETDALDLLGRLFRNHRIVLMVGGSGLYIHAVCHGMDMLPDPDPVLRGELRNILESEGIGALQAELRGSDPDYAATADLSNPVRLIRALEVCRIAGKPYSSLRSDKPVQRPFRILKLGVDLPREELNQRISRRVDAMMHAGLLEEAMELMPLRHLNAMNTVGYRELFEYLEGHCTLRHAVEKIKTNTRRYAKRQLTWFRRDKEMQWFRPEDVEGMTAAISAF